MNTLTLTPYNSFSVSIKKLSISIQHVSTFKRLPLFGYFSAFLEFGNDKSNYFSYQLVSLFGRFIQLNQLNQLNKISKIINSRIFQKNIAYNKWTLIQCETEIRYRFNGIGEKYQYRSRFFFFFSNFTHFFLLLGGIQVFISLKINLTLQK